MPAGMYGPRPQRARNLEAHLRGTSGRYRRPAAKCLRRAATLIEERGWCQAVSETPDGRLCLVGSIGRATKSGDVAAVAADAVMLQLLADARIKAAPTSLPRWNDRRGQKARTVVRQMRLAADRLEALA